MATVVLTVVGTAIGGPLGGAIGAAIGGYLDQEVFFKEEPPGGAEPTLDDVRLSTASEGAGIPFVIGNKNRVAGTIIWIAPELIEKVIEEEVGGKGGGGDDVVVGYEYFVSVAIAWGQNQERDIQFIDRIWASGNLFYKRQPTLFSIGPFDGSIEPQSGFFDDPRLRSFDGTNFDITTVTLGAPIDVSGFVDNGGVNNNTYTPVKKWKDDNGHAILDLEKSVYIENQLEFASDIFVVQDKPEFGEGRALSLTHYTGGAETVDFTSFSPTGRDAQPINSVILAQEGSLASAFREICYTLFEEFAITPFGNQVPQMSALIDAEGGGPTTVAHHIETIWARTGRPSSEIDTSRVTDTLLFADGLKGYSIVGPVSTREALRPILIASGVRVRETNGVLVFFDQGAEDTATVAIGDLSARTSGSNPPRRFRIYDPSSIELSQKSVIQFIDAAKSYQRGAAVARGFFDATNAGNVLSMSFSLVMTAAEAKKIGRREMLNAVTERQRTVWNLPPSYLELTVGDLVTVPVPISNDPDETTFENFEVLVTSINRGSDFVHVMKGFVEDSGGSEVSSDDEQGDDPPTQDDDIVEGSVCTLCVEDLPALGDAVISSSGFYWATALASRTDAWRGAVIYESSNDIDFSAIGTAKFEAPLGFANSVLADTTSLDWIDYENTVEVVVFHGELTGVSKEQLLAGANVALLGEELIAFKTATFLADGLYSLSGLIRGLRDTSDKTGTHVANEKFLLLQPTTLNFRFIDAADISTTRYYRAVHAGGSVANSTSVQLTRNAKTLQTFAPNALRAWRTNSGVTPDDINLKWLRRTRAITSFWSFRRPPLIEPSEIYEIDVYTDNTFATLTSGSPYSVTITSGNPVFVYTEAQQTSDGLTPGDPVNVDVFQISDNIGRGRAVRGTDI